MLKVGRKREIMFDATGKTAYISQLHHIVGVELTAIFVASC
jgi:hypothetical protein